MLSSNLKKSFIHFATKVKFAEMSPYIRLIQTMCVWRVQMRQTVALLQKIEKVIILRTAPVCRVKRTSYEWAFKLKSTATNI